MFGKSGHVGVVILTAKRRRLGKDNHRGEGGVQLAAMLSRPHQWGSHSEISTKLLIPKGVDFDVPPRGTRPLVLWCSLWKGCGNLTTLHGRRALSRA
jgi:hypothetical protein